MSFDDMKRELSRILEQKRKRKEYIDSLEENIKTKERHMEMLQESQAKSGGVTPRFLHFQLWWFCEAISEFEEAKLAAELEKNSVMAQDIAKNVSGITKIPLTVIGQSEEDELSGHAQALHNQVVGQEGEIQEIVFSIRAFTSHMIQEKDRLSPEPLLFVGPPTVGKALATKVVAGQLLGDRERLLAIDLSAYSVAYTVTQLVGSPPGYIRSEYGGMLVEVVRRRPYSVILFN
ncbi:hypothetical protein Tsubulata_024225 [Turnera subulata]|uniref:ATPase AAA-type core domain-containing protein n=1 Tax=Turnera subulata TaxID=218843 RepID=A0A9Q0FDG4_9ROSI|nr:hypothetical protein Tsubulata_024225 [Turnera subulata]